MRNNGGEVGRNRKGGVKGGSKVGEGCVCRPSAPTCDVCLAGTFSSVFNTSRYR